MIELTITKADSLVSNLETLTSGMVNAVFIRFNLSQHWQGLSKVAVFTNGLVTVDVLEPEWDSDDTCRVPPEVLETPWRTVKVGLKGVNGNVLVLPAIMQSIGRVKPGTKESGTETVPPTPEVWEQLERQIANLQAKTETCYTTLEKLFCEDHTVPTIIRIYLHGLDSLEGCPEVHLYHCMRRRGREYRWRHPANWDESAVDGVTKQGYGLLAGKNIANDAGRGTYPSVPDWMPNNGFMETVFPVEQTVLRRGYIDIDLTEWLLPLLKPIDAKHEWKACGLMGLQKEGEKYPQLFRFHIVRNGRIVGMCKQTLAVGLKRDLTSSPLDNALLIRPAALYTSIR